MKKVALIATTLLVATAGAASAHGVNGTQERQAARIEYGRETGKITWTEGLKLRAEQRRIARTEAEFRSDGYLSKSEYRKLKVMQKNAGHHISKEKSDGWKRAWWMPRFGL
jgi:uncharacterized protein HemX